MKDLLYLLPPVVVMVFWAVALAFWEPPQTQRRVVVEPPAPLVAGPSGERVLPPTGSLDVVPLRQRISGGDLDRLFAQNDGKSYVAFYNHVLAGDITMSAMATDNRHYIAHGYLVGYAPFATDSIWEPWYTLASRKSYELDDVYYRGRAEVWQTSKQAYEYSKGDCEDHAIALADWLIELGEDARVVIGSHGTTGHAWVVLFRDGNEYLLEATQKGLSRAYTRFPLASFQTRYRPKYMFNRDTFWVNEGTEFTTNYSSPAWKLRSRYGT